MVSIKENNTIIAISLSLHLSHSLSHTHVCTHTEVFGIAVTATNDYLDGNSSFSIASFYTNVRSYKTECYKWCQKIITTKDTQAVLTNGGSWKFRGYIADKTTS